LNCSKNNSPQKEKVKAWYRISNGVCIHDKFQQHFLLLIL